MVVSGTTLSGPFGPDLFPDVDALKAVNDSLLSDAFLARFQPDGTPGFVTLLGGPEADEGRAVAVDPQGQIFVAGTTGADLDGSGLARDNASIDVEEVSERDRIRPTDLAITKQAFRLPSIMVGDLWEYFFIGYLVTVSNLGDAEAYDLVVKDFLTWDGAFGVLPLEGTFLVGNGGTLTLDSWLPILPSAGTAELTAEIPTLAAGATTWVAYWTAGVRHLSQAPTTVVDTVFLGSAGEDPNPANNTAVVVTDL